MYLLEIFIQHSFLKTTFYEANQVLKMKQEGLMHLRVTFMEIHSQGALESVLSRKTGLLIAPITLMTRNKSEERDFSIGVREETFLEFTMDTKPDCWVRKKYGQLLVRPRQSPH